MGLKIGQKAPLFKSIDQNGENVELINFLGKKVVLFFYPKDNTPTCTIEVCNLRDNYPALKKLGYEILGVSADSQKKHKNFSTKFNLPFTLLVDEELDIIKKYDVWKEKTMFGKNYMGIVRTTFLIDENGNISDIIDKVESANHTEQIINKR
jgi:thioredoxin-dependent peroxiredoxin